MGAGFRVVWDRAAIAALKTDPEVQDVIERVGDDMAGELRAATPKASGLGAESVQSRPSRAKGARDIGWDKGHYYLIFPEYGTKYQAAQRFARDVLDRYTFTSEGS
jgi:hypothetical protein